MWTIRVFAYKIASITSWGRHKNELSKGLPNGPLPRSIPKVFEQENLSLNPTNVSLRPAYSKRSKTLNELQTSHAYISLRTSLVCIKNNKVHSYLFQEIMCGAACFKLIRLRYVLEWGSAYSNIRNRPLWDQPVGEEFQYLNRRRKNGTVPLTPLCVYRFF